MTYRKDTRLRRGRWILQIDNVPGGKARFDRAKAKAKKLALEREVPLSYIILEALEEKLLREKTHAQP